MKEKDTEKIRQCLRTFLLGWENTDRNLLESCLCDLPFAYVSMFGHAYTKEQITGWFAAPHSSGSSLSLIPLQDTVRTQEKEAFQYAVILGLIRSGRDHIAFGGTFMNHLVKTEGDWKIETLRFQLQSDNGMKEEVLDENGILRRREGCGNRKLFGNWLGVDERVGYFQSKIPGSGSMMITPELDSPWRAIQTSDSQMTDEEGIVDALCRVSCAFDFLSAMIAVPAFTDDAEIDIGGMFGEMNKRDAFGYAKELRRSMPRSFTGIRLKTLHTEKEKAGGELEILAPEAFAKTAQGPSFVKDRYLFSAELNGQDWKISGLKRKTE